MTEKKSYEKENLIPNQVTMEEDFNKELLELAKQDPKKWFPFVFVINNMKRQVELMNSIAEKISFLINKYNEEKGFINAVLLAPDSVSQSSVEDFLNTQTGISGQVRILNSGGTKVYGGISYNQWHFNVTKEDYDKIYNRLFFLGGEYWLYDYDELHRRGLGKSIFVV